MSTTEPPPRFIGEFELIRKLGTGGFGAVYLTVDRRLGRRVALKLAHPGRGDLRREARAAARLAHPNVVTIFEIGDHGERPYLVMEYVDGPTLRDRIAQEAVALPDALRIARDLAAALAAAHREEIVHLDLTPASGWTPRMMKVSPPVPEGAFPPGSPVPRDPPRTGSSHGPQARSRVAAGDERSELALDGAEDRATSNVAGGSRVAGGGRGPAPVAPVVSVGSNTGGD